MKKILALMFVVAVLAGCTQTQKGAAIGGATGAAIGGITTGRTEGALVGAAIGSLAGAVIGRVSENSQNCYYQDRRGRTYTARCPEGY